MTTVLLLLAFFQAGSTPGITVQVRTVDQNALALPGIEITAIEVSECRSRTQTSSDVVQNTTGGGGVASLSLRRAFIVEASANAKGIYLETPDQRTLSFPRQSGTSFAGPEGIVRFSAGRGHEVIMEFIPTRARATRRE
jgi:hypothetical protein